MIPSLGEVPETETAAKVSTSPFQERFLRFVLASGAAAVANFAARIVLSSWLAYPAAIALAFLVGLGAAFLLNRRFVFADATNGLHEQASWFVVVNLLGLAQTLLVSMLLAQLLLPWLGIRWHVEELAHAAGIVVPVLTSYLAHKRFSFRRDS